MWLNWGDVKVPPPQTYRGHVRPKQKVGCPTPMQLMSSTNVIVIVPSVATVARTTHDNHLPCT